MDSGRLKWRIRVFFAENNINASRLVESVHGKLSATSVYKFVNNPVTSKISTLEIVLRGLSSILGRDVKIEELVSYSSDSESKPAP